MDSKTKAYHQFGIEKKVIDARKTKTFQALYANLPILEVCDLVIGYVCFTEVSAYTAAKLGWYEVCQNLHPFELEDGMRGACHGGYLPMVILINSQSPFIISCGLFNACNFGNLNVATYLVNRDATDANAGMIGACMAGHAEIASLMVKHGANDFNYGLLVACMNGHKSTMRLMIECGATYCKCKKTLEEHVPKK